MPRRRAAKVVGIYGAIPAAGEPVADVVEYLEFLLKEAKRGGITGIATAWIGAAHGIHTQWCGVADSHAMVAGVTMLQHRVLAAKLADDD